ncbi:TPA: AAA family ATPase [Pseudomonas aeruginosa]|uniref:AAA family ATPase n=1 Tax=Pseudomonas aeruginosa TaxID=287 RepID=UPI000F82E0E4|nr:ATP-binding protein [Pseudomonas aeruginosa]ELM3823624.1 ATP-binding protein [Pseudomonas aeruginosa]MBH8744062.1 ATP-binding protein [Pseudomonas aeruginosa]MCU9057816.1 AAA family ATPase [Pseudomonas aeruginosa]MDI2469545.1 AAA family ATPase [Pseudomonas aeruginosa]MDI2584736.1 AAA family ATPase [Pseudomonas aeruginosa]
MRVRLDKVVINHFKRIESLEIDLQPVTALVGGNTSGKSSALQAAQLGVSILQAALRGIRANGVPDFAGTVANDAVLFRPTERLLDLRRGDSATQNLGYSITYCGVDLDTNANKQITVEIRRGKNANIAITRTGDDDLAAVLANSDRPFSIFTPGLSGIPIREEWRTKGAMDAAVMHGDANLYLRTVLDHLFTRDLDEMARIAWRRDRDISLLPDSGWKTFSQLLERCYPGTRIIVSHDHLRDRYVKVEVKTPDATVTLDMASTGMLQVIQIIAYACFYAPPLILLDEPDAHLHADSQARLYDALRSVAAETQTRILFASHSPQLIQRLMYDPDAAVTWMSEGAKVPVDDAQRPAIPILMTLGALSAGADAFDPARSVILMTEDKLPRPVTVLAKANGAPDNLAVLSYNGCGNLPAARLLANMITDMRPDARIILHRDRDFRTDQEMQFELLTAASERQRNGVPRVTEVFTPLNDVEHSFAQAEHLKEVFNELAPELIDAAIVDVTAFKRDEFVNAARVAREQVSSSLYDVPRKRKKPEWAESGMPDKAPPVHAFVPANGLTPVSFQHSHGKMLMDGLRPKIHHHVGGASQASDSRIYTPTEHLLTPTWREAFDLQ